MKARLYKYMYITIAAASTCLGCLVALKIRTTTTITVFCSLHRKYKGWHFVLIPSAKEAISMTCQALISGKNKTYILRCCLFSFLVSRFKVITTTRLFKYIENFTNKKNEKFQIKKSDIFLISAQNIDRGYSLEPPR